MPPATAPRPERALVLSGGIALGAFEAGVCAALLESGWGSPDWVAGASAGALNAVVFAGNAPDQRAAMLRRLWDSTALDPTPLASFLLGAPPHAGAWRAAFNEAAAMQTLLLGRPGLFRPRAMPPSIGDAPALYDLEPLLERLEGLMDFDRLNSGTPRVTIVATDVDTGERVVFDTGQGARIGPRHIIASSALLPIFAPVEVEGRLLADGGLTSNLPLDIVLDAPRGVPLECIAVELFARSGSRPRTIAAGVTRAGDIVFGNQTRSLLHGRARAREMRALLGRLVDHLPEELRAEGHVVSLLEEAGYDAPVTLAVICYHGAPDEAGPVKAFDFSAPTLRDRWAAGARAAGEALRRMANPAEATTLAPGMLLHEVAGKPAPEGPGAASES